MAPFVKLKNEKDTESKHKGHDGGRCKLKLPTENRTWIYIALVLIVTFIVLVVFKIYIHKYSQMPKLNPPPLRKTCPPPPKNPELAFTVQELLDGPISPSDARVIKHLRTSHLVPPSTKPYNLKNNEYSKVFEVHKALLEIQGTTSGGIFVDVGALDGETNSVSLGLEKELGWTGLLIESDFNLRLELKDKNRKAWIGEGCVSPFSYPRMMRFFRESKYESAIEHYANRKLTCSTTHPTPTGSKPCEEYQAQCYPLETYLKAMDYTKIDFLILNLQGEECEIVKTLPLKEFDIKFLQMNTTFLSQEAHMDCQNYINKFGGMEVDGLADKQISKIDKNIRVYAFER